MDQGQLRWGDGAALTLALSPRVLRTAAGEGERHEMMKNEPSRLRSIKPNPTKKNGPARIKAQAVGSRLARTKLDLGRTRCMRGNAERMNGKTKGLCDRNTFYSYDTDGRGLGIWEKSSLIFGYVRLCSLNGKKIAAT